MALALFAAGSLALLAALTLLVVSRKAMRDRRESASVRRRRHYRTALAGADPQALRRVLEGVRRREQQVDLAAVLQDPAVVRPDPEILDTAARAGLTPRLRAQLSSRTGPARGRAVLILTHLRLPDGVARLEHMLDDMDPDVRLVTCAGLPLSHRPEAVDALVRALSRRSLAPERVIERLGQPWAVESLLAALHRLDETGERRAAPRIGIARALGYAGDPRAEPALVRLLATGSLEERISAARALGSVGGRRSRSELERALTDESWPLRAQAAKALGKLAIKRSVPALERVLDDPAWWVRANAAGALRELGEPGHVALERALEHEDRYARDRARETLAMDRLVVPVA